MFGLGVSEVVVIGLVALVLLGPERLPEVARYLGRQIALLRRTIAELRMDEIRSELKISKEQILRDGFSQPTGPRLAQLKIANPPQHDSGSANDTEEPDNTLG